MSILYIIYGVTLEKEEVYRWILLFLFYLLTSDVVGSLLIKCLVGDVAGWRRHSLRSDERYPWCWYRNEDWSFDNKVSTLNPRCRTLSFEIFHTWDPQKSTIQTICDSFIKICWTFISFFICAHLYHFFVVSIVCCRGVAQLGGLVPVLWQ